MTMRSQGPSRLSGAPWEACGPCKFFCPFQFFLLMRVPGRLLR